MSAVYVRVIAAGEHYALPVSDVLEISELGEVAPVPGAPPEVLGLRNLRGRVIPVIDLAAVLGLDDDGPRGRIVVSEREDGERSGVAVTEIFDVGELGDSTGEAESRFLSGSILVNGDLVGLVDMSAILAADVVVAAA